MEQTKVRQAFTLAEVFAAKRVSEMSRSREQSRASVVRGLPKQKFVHSAFTLAEVLITLAIIGIVAVLTIPSVVKNYQKTQTETKLKKAYTTINRAYQMAMIDFGPANNWGDIYTSLDKTGPQLDALAQKYFIPYYKVAKICSSSEVSKKECYAYSTSTPLNLDGTNSRQYPDVSSISCFVLTDGTSLCLNNMSYGIHVVGITVDINGLNKPNVLGKDIFILNNGLYRTKNVFSFQSINCSNMGCLLDNTEGGCKIGNGRRNNGSGCGALIQRNGWKIPTKQEYINLGGTSAGYPW